MFGKILGKIITAIITMLAFLTNLSVSQLPAASLDGGGERIAYGDKACETMDIYLPAVQSDEVDVILLIHGGAWLMGNQSQYDGYLKKIADAGYVGVSVDYSKITNGADCAEMLSEIDSAVALTVKKIREAGLAADKMAVVGHSAGAQLALMYAYTKYESCPVDIAFVMSNSAIADFFIDGTDGSTMLERYASLVTTALCGTFINEQNSGKYADILKTINPVDNISASVPPTLVVQGDADTMVPYENALLLCDSLKEAGVPYALVTYEGVDHFLEPSDEQCGYARFRAFERFVELYF